MKKKTSFMWTPIINDLQYAELVCRYMHITTTSGSGTSTVGLATDLYPYISNIRRMLLSIGYNERANLVGNGVWCLNVLIQGGLANPPLVADPVYVGVVDQLREMCGQLSTFVNRYSIPDQELARIMRIVVMTTLLGAVSACVNHNIAHNIMESPYIDTLVTG